MNLPVFLQCLAVNGISTGNAIQSIYQFNSGDNNIIFNNLYPTGSFYTSGIINTVNTPLISIGQNLSGTTFFSGVHNFRVGYQQSNNFGLLLDIQYNACTKIPLVDYCILSSNNLSNSNKNFTLNINDANRIYFKSSGYISTLSKELSQHDFVYFACAENQYISFGIFNVNENQFYSNQIDLGAPNLNTDILYIGSEFNNFTTTGFIGNINSAILFQDPINDIVDCVNCYFATGFILNNNISTVQVPQITGVFYSGIVNNTSTSIIQSGLVSKENGQTVQVQYGTSLTGASVSGQIAIPLFSTTGVNVSQPTYTFLGNTGIITGYNTYTINFTIPLVSGDVLEAYTYYNNIPNIGYLIDSNYDIPNFSSGNLQIIANGLTETLNVDYSIIRNNISGYTSQDVLVYDITNTPPILNYYTGIASGNEDFLQTITYTGLSGVSTNNPYYPNFGYDIFLNGQKLISGTQYQISNSGVSGFIVNISGDNLSEVTFLPQFSGIIHYLSGINQTTQTLNNIYGFSEQIWVNGVRQTRNIDYLLYYGCSSQTGTLINNLPFQFYNNDNNWNFNLPPSGATNYNGVLMSGLGSLSGFYTWNRISTGNYPSGAFLGFYGNSGNGYNLISTLDVLATGYNWNIGGLNHANYCVKTKYISGNVMGQFSSGYCLTF